MRRTVQFVPARLLPSDRRFGVRASLVTLALTLVAVPFLLLVLLVEDKWRPLLRLDNGARDGLNSYALHNHGFVTVMRVFSVLGSSFFYWPLFALVVLWLIWRRLPRLAAFVVVTEILGVVLNSIVKGLVGRTRPVLAHAVDHATGRSFPSGHAQGSVIAYGLLLLVFLPVLHGVWRRVAAAGAIFMMLAIGFSRIALGVHYVSDVLAGYVLGGAWLAAMTALFSAWRRERGQPAVHPGEGLEPEQAERIAPTEPAERDPHHSPVGPQPGVSDPQAGRRPVTGDGARTAEPAE